MLESILEMNPILACDGYKCNHWLEIPATDEKTWVVSVPRKASKYSNVIVAAGQTMIAEWFATVRITYDIIDEAEEEITSQGYTFNRAGWEIIASEYDGKIPLQIYGVPEGTIVNPQTPIIGWGALKDDRLAWLPAYYETLIQSVNWKMSTVATICKVFRDTLKKYIDDTGAKCSVDYMMANFGDRSADGPEAAIMAGIAHAMLFNGSDCVQANRYIKRLYNTRKSYLSSIEATEHGSMLANSDSLTKNDLGAARMLVDRLKKIVASGNPNPMISGVIDTYNSRRFVQEYLGEILHDEIVNSGGKLICRPDCYDELTQIFTNAGWIFFKELNNTHLVAEILDDGSYHFVKPNKIISQYYSGDMIQLSGANGKLDLLVTPNHRMIIMHNGNMVVETAENSKFYHAKNLIRSARVSNNSTSLSNIERLQIAFQADGSYTTSGNKIRFSFSKQRKIDRLIDILEKCNISYKIYNLSDNRVEFNIDIPASRFHKDFEWVDIEHLSYDWCVEFIEELSYWDSTRRSNSRFKFDTTNKKVSDIVEIIALSAGYGVLTCHHIDDRKENFSDVYTSNILKRNSINGQVVNKKTISYDGMVYCVNVNSGRVLVKRNRCTVVCGNSGDPTIEPGLVGNDIISKFGFTYNGHGYKVLPPFMGVIQGDGIDVSTFENVLKGWVSAGFSLDNFVLGCGNGISHYGSRDDFGFSVKSVASFHHNRWHPLLKDPITDSGKKSLSGLVQVDDNLNVITKTDTITENSKWVLWSDTGERKYRQSFDSVMELARK